MINIGLSDSQVAGAAADAGLRLEEVAEQARHASELVGTVGVALSVCTLPGQETSDRLGPEQIELGLGIVSLLSMNLLSAHKCNKR
jgi:dihydroxyacetone kinase